MAIENEKETTKTPRIFSYILYVYDEFGQFEYIVEPKEFEAEVKRAKEQE